MEQFVCKTKILSGIRAAEALRELACKRLFLVADPFFEKNGTAAKIAAESGVQQTYLFSQVTSDPTVEQVAAGVARLREFNPDTVVALGGGSAMDCAKAMIYFSGLEVYFAAIPTTSGSGSEVTDFSILTHNGVKHPLIDERLCPHLAILDPTLLKELPQSLIADGGFDVLSHALEAFVSRNAGAFSDALAAEAFAESIYALPRSFNGSLLNREKMHLASAMAGLSFSRAGLGLCHAMAHAIGGIFHLPHGRINAILLPAVITANSRAAMTKYARIARRAGFGGSADTIAVRNLKNGLIRLRKELGMSENFAQAGIDPRTVWQSADRIVQATLSDPCSQTNPVQVEDFTVRRILEEVTGRG